MVVHEFTRNNDFRETKVSDLHTVALANLIRRNKDVLRFQVTMHDACQVQILKTLKDLVDNVGTLSFIHLTSLDVVEQLTSSDVLHYYVNKAL